jgi:hypothetical protein
LQGTFIGTTQLVMKSGTRKRKLKKTPVVLVIESQDPSKNIILALSGLEENNKELKDIISETNREIEDTKNIIRRLGL